MTSTQFGNRSQKNDLPPPYSAVPLPAQGNFPALGYNSSPNPQMWNASIAQQLNHPAAQQWNNPPFTVIRPMTQPIAFHEEFLKGNPKALGAILIVVGILHIGMGIGLVCFTTSYAAIFSGIPFWGAVFNIIAGSLSVAAVSKPNICLIKGSLSLSIIISIISVLGLILNIVDFFAYYYCYDYDFSCFGIIPLGHALRGMFILTYLLQFSISIRISVLACRAQKHSNLVPTQVFVLQNIAATLQPSAVLEPYPIYSLQNLS